jgi:energy-coupling factor transporter ATP-binding protein EcfA2
VRIRQISVNDYKAISEISISMNKNLIPIIGINESGKTTILEAIQAFMPDNDNFYDGFYLEPTNIYTKKNNAFIRFEIEFENRGEFVDIHRDSHQTIEVNNIFRMITNNMSKKGTETLIIHRHLPSQEYFCTSPDGSIEYERGKYGEAGFISIILDLLPRIIYFDDFFDDIPNLIEFLSFEGEIKNIEAASYTGTQTEWHSVLRQFFERLDIDFESWLNRFEQQHDPNYDELATYNEQLEQVQNELNNCLASDWAWFTGKVKDNNSVIPYEVRLQHHHTRDKSDGKLQHEHAFRLRLVDKLNPDEKGAFNVRQRSKGFQWYCNFILKLRYNPRFTDTRNRAIFLLDEPGAYLHSHAQDRLLDRLIDISKTNPIIYTTHLPQLVNPWKIRLSDCWVADRDTNEITLKKYGEMQDIQNLGALTTLHNAIKLNLPAFIFPNSPIPFAITEGITDFYVFDMIKKFTNIFDNFEVSFIPGSGVTHLNHLISLAITWSDTYVIIFDKDDEADKAIVKYTLEYGEQENSKHWIQIDNKRSEKKVTLEKLFSDDDIKQLSTTTGKQNPKKAFGILYYSSSQEKQNFWGQITQETIDNFSLVATKIAMIIN